MSKQLGVIWSYLSHYKYLIVIIVGVLVVGVIDDNSICQHVKYQIQISNLRSEIKKYTARYTEDSKVLREMRMGTRAYEKIARERYFMKADDEDIFVLSTDLPKNNDEEQYRIEVTMVGVFKCNGNSTPEQKDSFGRINGAAIIFPFIREHIANIALKAGLGVVILPPVNFTKINTKENQN